MPVDGSRPPAPLLASPFNERGLHFSPDGQFAAFTSDESGRAEIYVAPSTLLTAKRRISSGGGSIGRWNPDGRELFYLAADGHAMAVPIRTAPALELGAPVPLFAIHGRWPWRDFDVAPDGKRFLAIVPRMMANEQAVTVVVNCPLRCGDDSYVFARHEDVLTGPPIRYTDNESLSDDSFL